MPAGPGPICWACDRLRDVDTCDAFPDGIPRRILFEHFDHRNPFPGDRSVRFRLRPDRRRLLELFDRVEEILAHL